MADSLVKSIDQVAVVVRDIDRAMERYTNELGIEPWSVYSDGAYAYFETERAPGCIVEAIEMPQEMGAPERTFPE